MITFTAALRAPVAILANQLVCSCLRHGSCRHWDDAPALLTDNRLEENRYGVELPQESESYGEHGNGPKDRFEHLSLPRFKASLWLLVSDHLRRLNSRRLLLNQAHCPEDYIVL